MCAAVAKMPVAEASAISFLSPIVTMELEAIFIKRLTVNEPAMRILVINNIMGSTVAVTVAAFVWTAPTNLQWVFLVTLGVVLASGQALFIQSMKRREASLVMPAFYVVLVFAALPDLVLFGVRPGMFAFVGSTMIVLSAVLLSRMRS